MLRGRRRREARIDTQHCLIHSIHTVCMSALQCAQSPFKPELLELFESNDVSGSKERLTAYHGLLTICHSQQGIPRSSKGLTVPCIDQSANFLLLQGTPATTLCVVRLCS